MEERTLRDHEILKQIGHLRLSTWKRVFKQMCDCVIAIRRYECIMDKPTELLINELEKSMTSNTLLDDINLALKELEKEREAEKLSQEVMGQ